jgi:hypothetical protein
VWQVVRDGAATVSKVILSSSPLGEEFRRRCNSDDARKDVSWDRDTGELR